MKIAVIHRAALSVAPEAVVFEALLEETELSAKAEEYDVEFHSLSYKWDFGDGYQFNAPQKLTSEHLNAGIAFGPRVSHTYRAAGTYQVTLSVADPNSDKIEVAHLSIKVGDPDAVFAGRRTIFVDPDGDFTKAPIGAGKHTDLRIAFEDTIAAGAKEKRRIILNRGKTYPLQGQIWPIAPPSFHVVASPGKGQNPTIDWAPASGEAMMFLQNVDDRNDTNPAKSVVFQNIQMQGDVDVTKARGTAPSYFFNLGPYPPHDLLLDGCSLRHVTLAIYDRHAMQNADDQAGLCHKVFNDCIFEDWAAAAIFEAKQSSTSLIGCRFVQNPDAIADGDGQSNAVIAPYRGEIVENLVIDACDFFQSTGWSKTPTPRYKAIQPAVRFNTAANRGARLSMQRCAVEAGFELVSLSASNFEDSVPVNALIEKCTLLGSWQSWWFFDINYGGVTIRNNVFIRPDVTDKTGVDPRFVCRFTFRGRDPDALAAPIEVYNNTLVNLLADAKYNDRRNQPMVWKNGDTSFKTVRIVNNVDYQPNLSHPKIEDGPLDTQVIALPRNTGYLSTTVIPKDTTLATPENSLAIYAPLLGSSALGDAMADPVAYDDFYGHPRPQYPSRGAFEVSS